MGYFANGTEGELYWNEYCSRCVHDVDMKCPVWHAHLRHNYDDSNNDKSILHLLIPRKETGGNEQCRMFVPIPVVEE